MIARTISLALAALIALVVLHADPARAQPDATARAKAAAHFRQGQAYFQLKDFDRALAEYQAALDLSAEPLLVFNMALCHDRANRPEEALAAFQRYLELAPNGTVADEAREDVARLTPIVAKIQADRQAKADAEREEAAKRNAAAQHDAAARREAHDAAERRRVWVERPLLAVGAAGVVTGAIFHVLARGARDDAKNARDPDTYFAKRDTLTSERTIAIGAYAAGAVTIAAGLILGRVLGPHGGVEASAEITPHGASVLVGWSR